MREVEGDILIYIYHSVYVPPVLINQGRGAFAVPAKPYSCTVPQGQLGLGWGWNCEPD